MKIREGFMLRQVADNYVIVPVGKATYEFNGMIKINETGAFIWECLKEDLSLEALVDFLVKEYDVTREVATNDLSFFINELEKAHLIE